MRDPKCIFCNFTDKSVIVFEDSECFGLISKAPLNKYHVILIPLEHFTDTQDLPDDLLGHLYATAKKLGKAVRSASGAQGITTIHDDGIQKTQDHFTLHIIPRFSNEKIGGLFVREENVGITIRARYAREISDALKAVH